MFRDDNTRSLFVELHGDLASVAYWLERQRVGREEIQQSVYLDSQMPRFKHRYGR